MPRIDGPRGHTAWLLVTLIWPTALILKFLEYAAFDSPTHFIFWGATRVEHALFYIIPCLLVSATIGPTKRQLLVVKAGALTGVTIISALGDLYVNETTSAKLNSAGSWIAIGAANIAIIWFRLMLGGDRERV